MSRYAASSDPADGIKRQYQRQHSASSAVVSKALPPKKALRSQIVPISCSAAGAADTIKQQHQRQKARPLPSLSPDFKRPDEVAGPYGAGPQGNFTASAIAATAASGIIRQKYQLESAIQAGVNGSGASTTGPPVATGSMKGKAPSNATATRKNGTGSLLV